MPDTAFSLLLFLRPHRDGFGWYSGCGGSVTCLLGLSVLLLLLWIELVMTAGEAARVDPAPSAPTNTTGDALVDPAPAPATAVRPGDGEGVSAGEGRKGEAMDGVEDKGLPGETITRGDGCFGRAPPPADAVPPPPPPPPLGVLALLPLLPLAVLLVSSKGFEVDFFCLHLALTFRTYSSKAFVSGELNLQSR
jgi:hypothetical protein